MIVPTTPIENKERCYTCHQRCQLYRRQLYNVPARMLIVLYRLDPYGYVYVPPLCHTYKLPGGDATLAHHWGLISAQPGERDDGSDRVGWWRLTNNGRNFVLGRLFIRRYAMVYNSACHSHAGKWWSIYDALGNKFDYQDLMGL